MSKKLLFVDDEQSVLNALNRTFMDSEYEVQLAASAAEALGILEKTPVDLIMTDIRMPEMDGYALLRAVRERYPDIIRTVLSGYSDKTVFMKLITDGTAKVYMTKPWDNDTLKADIAAILTAYDTTREHGVLHIVDSIEKLPVLPTVYRKILKLIEEDAAMSEIASYIETEPDYSARILRIINSSFYGVKTGSVKQAIVYIGLDTVKNIVLSSEAFMLFSDNPANVAEIEILWEHSNLCNKLFYGLYQIVNGKKIPNEFAASGLLRDLGRLIILRYFPKEYMSIKARHNTGKEKCITDIEQQVIGAAHTQLGAHLLNWWNLPGDMVDACLYHHGPFTGTMRNRETIALLHLADVYSWQQVSKSSVVQPDPGAHSLVNIGETALKENVKRIIQQK